MTEVTHKPLRVLQVVDTLGMGGAETWLMEMLRYWSRSGEVQMDFLLTSGNKGIFDDEAVALGSKLHYIPYGRKALPHFVRRFRQLLKDCHYDAIHDHQDFASGWHFLFGAGRLPKNRITHIHNPSYQILNNYGTSISRRLTSRIGKGLVGQFATHIAGTSGQVIKEYGFRSQIMSKQPGLSAVHCAFNVDRFSADHVEARRSVRNEFGWDASTKIILLAGRIDRSPDPGHPQNHKNSGLAIQIAIDACHRDPSICMVACGRPSVSSPALQQRIDQAGLSTRIILAGIRKDIDRFLMGADILLFPSRGEGLGMVAVEAQAAGLPVLASTAVPRECVVVPRLVTFLELDRSVEMWTTTLLSILGRERGDLAEARRLVAQSPFSINVCRQILLTLYRHGTLT